MPIRVIILLVFFLVSLPICFARPFYGLLLWTVVAFLNPQQYTWAAESFPWAQAVAIPTLLGFVLFSGGWKRLAARAPFLMIVLWIWFTVTTVISTNTPMFQHHAQDTWDRWEFVSKVLLMTLVTVGIVDSFARLRTFVLVTAGCFGLFVLKSFPFIISTGGNYRLYGPPNSMIADNNDFGLALNMTLPLFFFLAQTESNQWVKRLCGFLFIITIPAIFFTYSRGALVGLVAISILMFVQVKQRLILVPVAALGILVALLFAPEAWRSRMDPTSPDAIDGSALERLNAWAFSRHLASDFPIAGAGFATFTPELFMQYAPDALDIKGPHSIYFQVLAEHGYVGLFLYLSLVVSCFVSARRLIKQARIHGDPLIASYANMFWFSLVGFLSSGTFLGRAYFDYFFSIAACLCILERVAREKWTQTLHADIQRNAEPDDKETSLPHREVAL